MRRETLTGWGRTPVIQTNVASPHEGDFPHYVSTSRSAIARGLGRAYGDSAVSSGGSTLVTGLLNSIDSISDGRVVIDAGVSIDALLKVIVPLGWFIPVTPGTRFVTVGGAIAADIHGKNHHHDGSFGDYVEWIEIILADGRKVKVSSSEQADLFWSTIGGMGLTGVITRASIRLRLIETSRIKVLTTSHPGLDDLMSAMVERDRTYRYTVAWVDTLASGESFGRSVLMAGEHAEPSALSSRERRHLLSYNPRVRLGVPRRADIKFVQSRTVRAFNEFWYRKSPRKPSVSLDTIGKFFYPLDGVRDWNRLYGKYGFVQYQFVVPDSRSELIGDFLRLLSVNRVPAFLSVLKRFGAAGHGWMSFPMAGWTLAVDIPADTEDLGRILDDFDERVASAGGRVYLAKDSRMRPSVVPAMYPRLGDFQRLRHKIDPRGVFASHQSRRLGL